MSVKIRLQRHGKKGKPFYWVVAADARSKRDGKYLEKIGTYNPNTNPATIDLDLDSAVQWLHNGAQVSYIANVSVASANTATTIDTMDTSKYRSSNTLYK